MRTLTVKLEGTTPLSFSRYHTEPWKTNATGSKAETHEEYDTRTWRSKLHVLEDGSVYIPPMALKGAMEGAAGYNPTKKKGSATWTRNLTASVVIQDSIVIDGVKAKDVESETLPMTSDGKPSRYSKGSRVARTFPLIRSGWKADATLIVLDDTLPQSVVEQALGDAGVFVGIGRWRAENRGLYGRFRVVSKKWN
jgi:hypothetical protein